MINKKSLFFLIIILGIVIYRIVNNPSLAVFSYIVVSYFHDFDNNVVVDNNYDGEVEDKIFTHRFIHLDNTYSGLKVIKLIIIPTTR